MNLMIVIIGKYDSNNMIVTIGKYDIILNMIVKYMNSTYPIVIMIV